MTLACIGIGVSRAIALGPAFLMKRHPIEVTPSWIKEHEVEAEIQRFRQALEAARQELQLVRAQIPSSTPPDIADFIDAHLLMLEDVTFTEAPLELIRNQLYRAEWALQVRRDAIVEVFESMDDPYLKTRKDDVNHVVIQIQKCLMRDGDEVHTSHEDITGHVIIAQDLSPADTILLRYRGVAAFVTEFGGPLSHTAILARSIGIPAVLGLRNATQYLQHGEMLVVDGEQGVVLASLDATILEAYHKRLGVYQIHKEGQRRLASKPSQSLDKVPIKLFANIELPEDIYQAIAYGAAGVGLYRTEFMYMNRGAVNPDEEEHLEAYLKVVRGLNGIPVTIRTLDLGADKQIINRDGLYYPPACNPALGLRAIRLCLKEPELFKPQIRAILRAAAYGPVRLMVPMLSNLNEIFAIRQIIEEAKQELHRDGLRFNADIPFGGMIEVPSAALCAYQFAKHLDFLSIGTNDLIQYTLAIDRVDEDVNYLFDPLHPAVLKLIRMTIVAGQRCNIPVTMCGEMAGEPRYTRILLGLGLRRFSMESNSILDVKEMICNSDISYLTRTIKSMRSHIAQGDTEVILEALNQSPI
ncbi:phosphoenolpyruvate-protein phosphotransferase [Achromatium sp. WMS3]|nr:phosphoenolpyruvate-protein phosphotransferase [Achromatium sp. WMS3]